MEVSVLESLTLCSQKRFPLLAETSNFRGFWFQAVAADLLSCVEICGFGVLSPATKLTTLAFSFVTLKGHGTTPKNQTCKDCWTTTPLCTAVGYIRLGFSQNVIVGSTSKTRRSTHALSHRPVKKWQSMRHRPACLLRISHKIVDIAF